MESLRGVEDESFSVDAKAVDGLSVRGEGEGLSDNIEFAEHIVVIKIFNLMDWLNNHLKKREITKVVPHLQYIAFIY